MDVPPPSHSAVTLEAMKDQPRFFSLDNNIYDKLAGEPDTSEALVAAIDGGLLDPLLETYVLRDELSEAPAETRSLADRLAHRRLPVHGTILGAWRLGEARLADPSLSPLSAATPLKRTCDMPETRSTSTPRVSKGQSSSPKMPACIERRHGGHPRLVMEPIPRVRARASRPLAAATAHPCRRAPSTRRRREPHGRRPSRTHANSATT